MRKLCASKNPDKRIHPSPLSLLPSALVALASVLSPDDQLVLSYLLASHGGSSSQQQRRGIKSQDHDGQSHPPDLGCSCFGCYKSFWARWDSSPDRHVIHAILDAFEEEEAGASGCSKKKKKKKKDGKGGKSKKKATKTKEGEAAAAAVVQEVNIDHVNIEKARGDGGEDEGDEKSSVRRFFGWVLGINN